MSEQREDPAYVGVAVIALTATVVISSSSGDNDTVRVSALVLGGLILIGLVSYRISQWRKYR